jgi:hypothetical protein
MATIINATQHNATQDQKAVGVFDLETERQRELQKLLTFDTLPTAREVQIRAEKIKKLIDVVSREQKTQHVMIAGAPFLLPLLQRELQKDGYTVLYAFSERVSVEVEKDGVVTKTNVFKHVGFVEVS